MGEWAWSGQEQSQKYRDRKCSKCSDHEKEVADMQKEIDEQARLNGMGSEREARLLAIVAEKDREIERLKNNLAEKPVFVSGNELKLESRIKTLTEALKRLQPFISSHGGDLIRVIDEALSEVEGKQNV